MKWTGADILVQLEGGWEIDEIASATGLGIAEVRRLVRDERYRMRQQIKEEEVAEKSAEIQSTLASNQKLIETQARLEKENKEFERKMKGFEKFFSNIPKKFPIL